MSESSELNERRWAVVSHDKVHAEKLTYFDAAYRAASLKQKGITSTVVTQEVADRMLNGTAVTG
jgi:hypothetical protein